MRNKVIINLIWRFLERCGAQLVTFVVSIVLARILSPEEYGQIAIILVIITILNVFVDGGFANALIQKKDSDQLDFSTVFFFNIVTCLFLYGLVFMLAPLVGLFYNDSELVPLTRVLSLIIVISGVKNLQQAYVSKHFLFKKFFFATLGGTLFSAVLGVFMAIKGFGVWSLVAQYLTNAFIDTCILWITVRWRPTMEFSVARLKTLFLYGYKLLLSSLLNTVYSNFRQLIIGKMYSASELGFYNRGKQFPSLVMTNINTSIDSVLFPAMAEKQDDIIVLKEMIKKSINVSTFALWPLLFGLCAVSEPLVRIILTDKWLLCVPYLQIFCFVFATFPIQTANLNALKAVGRSDLFFRIEIEQTIVGIILLLTVCKISPMWIAIMYLVASCFNCVIICYETKKIFDYSLLAQLCDVLANMILSAVMLGVTWALYRIFQYPFMLIIQIVVGGVVYFFGAILFKNTNLSYLISMLKNHKSKKE